MQMVMWEEVLSGNPRFSVLCRKKLLRVLLLDQETAGCCNIPSQNLAHVLRPVPLIDRTFHSRQHRDSIQESPCLCTEDMCVPCQRLVFVTHSSSA